MDLGLKNKVVLVAGSSRGIGEAIARTFLQEGANVVVTGRSASDLKKTAGAFKRKFSGRVLEFSGDLTREIEIRKCIATVVRKWKRLDVVVAGIGSGKSNRPLQADHKEWRRMLDKNLLGAVALASETLPLLRRQKSGCLVFISSIAGVEHIGAPEAYAAAKSALLSYVKSLAAGLAAEGIRVNAVAPGNIKFPGGRWEEISKERPQAVKDMIKREVPLNRFGTPQEVAAAVAFLASDRASFITGSCLTVDGGQTRRI